MRKPNELTVKEKAAAFDGIKEGVAILSAKGTTNKKERAFYNTVLYKIYAVESDILMARRKKNWFKRILSRQ